jgi:hypothetical protein
MATEMSAIAVSRNIYRNEAADSTICERVDKRGHHQRWRLWCSPKQHFQETRPAARRALPAP